MKLLGWGSASTLTTDACAALTEHTLTHMHGANVGALSCVVCLHALAL